MCLTKTLARRRYNNLRSRDFTNPGLPTGNMQQLQQQQLGMFGNLSGMGMGLGGMGGDFPGMPGISAGFAMGAGGAGTGAGGPSSPITRVLVCAARTLNATGQPRVTLSLRSEHFKSSLWAMAGGKGA